MNEENEKQVKADDKRMSQERLMELVAYAKVCFEHCTSPFDSTHLIKKVVKSFECIDLSHFIAELLDNWLIDQGVLEAQEAVEQAEREFMETQKE